MKTTTLLSTAAAALLIGSGFALAQDKGDAAPERAPPAQRSAPAEKVAPPMNAGERKVPKTTGQGTTGQGTVGQGAEPAAKPDMKPDTKPEMNKSDRSDMKPSTDKDASSSADKDRKSSTTGQGAAAGAAKLSTEQRSKITTIIRQKKVEPVNLDITINVGTRVPPTVRFYPVPVEVIEVYPEWRGYDYIIVGGDILILEPDSHVIVAIIAA